MQPTGKLQKKTTEITEITEYTEARNAQEKRFLWGAGPHRLCDLCVLCGKKIHIIPLMQRILLFLLLVCTVSCAGKKTDARKALRISFTAHPTTLDPRKSGDFASSTLICLIYEGLTRALPDGSVEPALAETIDVSDDQLVYTFHLRDSIWSNGEPVTAYDFERSWKAILDPNFPSLCPYLLYPVRNGEKCAKGEALPSEIGMRAVNANTLIVTLERPTPYFLSLTAFPLLLPFKEEGLTNGPFKIEKMVVNSEISLLKNPKYWNGGAIALDQIHISILSDEMTAFHMFERGQLDWLGSPFSPIPVDVVEIFKGKEELKYIPMAATTFCTFNTDHFPFSNKNLRKAFSYAIDRVEIVDNITQAGQIAATRYLPPSLQPGSSAQLFVPAFDPDLARNYLQKGLQELSIKESDLQELVLYFKPGQVEKRLATALQRQWHDVLGVSVQLQQLDNASQMQLLQNRNYMIALGNWIAQFHDPVNILERFKSKANLKNYPGWENPEYIALLEKASYERSQEKRLRLLEEAEKILAEETPLTPIYHWSNPSLNRSHLFDIPTTPNGGILFERAQIK